MDCMSAPSHTLTDTGGFYWQFVKGEDSRSPVTCLSSFALLETLSMYSLSIRCYEILRKRYLGFRTNSVSISFGHWGLSSHFFQIGSTQVMRQELVGRDRRITVFTLLWILNRFSPGGESLNTTAQSSSLSPWAWGCFFNFKEVMTLAWGSPP